MNLIKQDEFDNIISQILIFEKFIWQKPSDFLKVLKILLKENILVLILLSVLFFFKIQQNDDLQRFEVRKTSPHNHFIDSIFITYNFIKNYRNQMIWIENEGKTYQTNQKEIYETIQASLRNFKLFAYSKSISSTFLPKICNPSSISICFLLFVPFQCTQAQISTKITFEWSLIHNNFQVKAQFKFHQIGGKKLCEINQRTKMEFISSLRKVNQYLFLRNSCLSIKFDLIDSLIMDCQSIFILGSPQKQFKLNLSRYLERVLTEFIQYFAELNSKGFLGTQSCNSNLNSLEDVLNKFQKSTLKIFIKPMNSGASTSIKSCLSLIFQKAQALQSSINTLKQSNRSKQQVFKPYFKKEIEKKNIGNAIKIHKKKKNANLFSKKFKQNMIINQAVSSFSSVELNIVDFQVRKSFGTLRKRHSDSYLVQSPNNESSPLQQDYLVFKRCKSMNKDAGEWQNTSESQMTKSQIGQSNQYNFLMYLGNLSFPYIAKYYLDISQDSISKISDRTIITRFQNGDLYTEVSYKQDQSLKNYSFIEYLIIFQQIAKTIVFLNENRLIHRDLKPTNILFDYRGKEFFYCKFIDFGSCYCLRSEYSHLFSTKVYTTKQFNLTYHDALCQSNGSIKQLITEQAYSIHQNFDIYAAAQTLSYLLKNTLYDKRSDFLQQIINICKNPNPNLRFTAQELLVVVQNLKFSEMAKRCPFVLKA